MQFFTLERNNMAPYRSDTTWTENPEDVIVLVNRSSYNYVLDLPSGRYRLDAGRRMRTLKSILNLKQVKSLIDQGHIAITE